MTVREKESVAPLAMCRASEKNESTHKDAGDYRIVPMAKLTVQMLPGIAHLWTLPEALQILPAARRVSLVERSSITGAASMSTALFRWDDTHSQARHTHAGR